MKTFRTWIALLALTAVPSIAFADYETDDEQDTYKATHRVSISGGLSRVNNQNSATVFAAYEYRFSPTYGVGLQASQVFSDPSLTQLALPGLYMHLAKGDWYIYGAPLAYISKGAIDAGVRVLTYIPLKLKFLRLSPILGADIIQGKTNYIFGIGFSIGN